jgi:hypothetical protein
LLRKSTTFTGEESESYESVTEGNDTPRVESMESARKFEEDKVAMNEDSKV